MSSNTHKKVIWFYITMDEIFILHIFNSANHLNNEE